MLGNAKKIFEKMRKTAEKFDFGMGEADLYRKAAKIEEESKRFYSQKAQEATDPVQKEIFHKLAQEEDKHLLLDPFDFAQGRLCPWAKLRPEAKPGNRSRRGV